MKYEADKEEDRAVFTEDKVTFLMERPPEKIRQFPSLDDSRQCKEPEFC